MQAGPFVITIGLDAFGYSKLGTLVPPDLLDETEAPQLWTPDFDGEWDSRDSWSWFAGIW